ncbi:MAG: preprotein translocase subunit YajC [Treponemataceae bacterium]|nr:preprotein translocase subunit YajC [Treponemataceae bacterium]
MFDVLLQAATQAAGQTAGKGNMLMSIVPFVLIFVVFYFFLIRPQNKKQKETQKMISALKKGDKVVTIGGIHGVVTNTKEETIVIRVDDNAKIEINRSAVSTVITDKVEKKEEAAEPKKKFSLFSKKQKDAAVEVKAEEVKADSKKEEAKKDEAKKDEAKVEAVEEKAAEETEAKAAETTEEKASEEK